MSPKVEDDPFFYDVAEIDSDSSVSGIISHWTADIGANRREVSWHHKVQGTSLCAASLERHSVCHSPLAQNAGLGVKTGNRVVRLHAQASDNGQTALKAKQARSAFTISLLVF